MSSSRELPELLNLAHSLNVRRITLHDPSSKPLVRATHAHKSPIAHITTRSHGTALHFLLTYPTALQTLTYEFFFGMHGSLQSDLLLQTAAIQSGLKLHAHSLTHLTLTRAQPDKAARNLAFYAHFPAIERINFKSCAPNLRSLRTVRKFLTPRRMHFLRVADILPPRLRTLTVFYDDTRNSPPFLKEADASEEAGFDWWLDGLAAEKEECVPELERVVVLSREWRDSWDKNLTARDLVVEPLGKAFEAVGVRFRANLEVQWGDESWTD